jgi:hypothetical protein
VLASLAAIECKSESIRFADPISPPTPNGKYFASSLVPHETPARRRSDVAGSRAIGMINATQKYRLRSVTARTSSRRTFVEHGDLPLVAIVLLLKPIASAVCLGTGAPGDFLRRPSGAPAGGLLGALGVSVARHPAAALSLWLEPSSLRGAGDRFHPLSSWLS